MPNHKLNKVIPLPNKVEPQSGMFSIRSDTTISYSPKTRNVAKYLATFMRRVTGYSIPLMQQRRKESYSNSINLYLAEIESFRDGQYNLSVTEDNIQINSPTQRGVFYGTQTLRQLLPVDIELEEPEKDVGWNIDAVFIEDAPKYEWRGLHLDVARHLYSVEFIKKFIDLMALHKFNIFHWHLTDDQGWRIEIKKFPLLTEIGGYRNSSPLITNRNKSDNSPYGGFYTQDQIRQIVDYAAERFIVVVPEIEMPGHALAALAAYPEFGCEGMGYEVAHSWGMKEDVFCAGNEDLYEFLEEVLIEVLSLFPSEFIHIGGDECPKERWKSCPQCQEKIKAEGLRDEFELQSYFIRRIDQFLTRKNRRLIGWDEILEGGLAPNAAVMSWRGNQGGITAVNAGHEVVMTPNSHCYFDYYQSEDVDSEPPAIGGYIPLEKTYEFDPAEGVPADKNRFIIGGQGNIWTEYMPRANNVEYMTYPRASALAEALWSGNEKDYDDFLIRLDHHLRRLDLLDVNYRPLSK